MNPEDFSPVPLFIFRLIAFWYKERFNQDIGTEIDKQYIELINSWNYDREGELSSQSGPLKSEDYKNIIRIYSQKEIFNLEDYENLFAKNVSRWNVEKDTVRIQQLASRAKEVKKQLTGIPVAFADKYFKDYNNLYYFVQQLTKWGYFRGNLEDNNYVALRMHEILCELERFYISDLDNKSEKPPCEINTELVTNFLAHLNPEKMDTDHYKKMVSSVLYYFASDANIVSYFKYKEPYYKIIQDNFYQKYNLVWNFYNPLKKMAKEHKITFEFVNEGGEVEKTTRDLWVCKFYDSVVNIKNMEFRKRSLNFKITAIEPNTLKSMASKFSFTPQAKFPKKVYEKKFQG